MAVNAIYFENKEDNKIIAFINVVLAPLWYSIVHWFAVFLITTGTLYGSAMFSMQHDIFPPVVAIPLAIGIEWTYLSGLAYATETQSDKWSIPMILVGALTSGLFGILYVLGMYHVIPTVPDAQTSFLLAMAHVIPLIILIVVYTFCKRHYLTELASAKKALDDRAKAIEDDTLEYNRTVRDAKLRLILAREELKLQELQAGIVVKDKAQKTCDFCSATLNSGSWLAMKRRGYCNQCGEKRDHRT
jgi:Na+(H+)/acetate symporter ActP